jgi:hypothetical protein
MNLKAPIGALIMAYLFVSPELTRILPGFYAYNEDAGNRYLTAGAVMRTRWVLTKQF